MCPLQLEINIWISIGTQTAQRDVYSVEKDVKHHDGEDVDNVEDTYGVRGDKGIKDDVDHDKTVFGLADVSAEHICKGIGNSWGMCYTLPVQWTSYQIRKLRVAHATGMPGMFPPPPRVSDPDMHHGACETHVPWCMPGSLTSRFLRNRWRGKRSPHSRRMRNPQFYVSGEMITLIRLWTHIKHLFARSSCRVY